MGTLTVPATYQLARAQRLSHAQAVIAVAIAIGESGLNSAAEGDTTITTSTWGPSVGLWQIRSLKAEYGTGGTRDAARLKDPSFNARSMAAISSGGTSWGPWSVYTSGAYRANLARVESETSALANSGGLPAGQIAGPLPLLDAPSDPLSDLGGWYAGAVVDTIEPGLDVYNGVTGALGGVLEDVLKGVVIAAGVGLGVTLVAIGGWRAVTSGGGS